MKTGNTRVDFTGRVYGSGSSGGARAVNWENPYINTRNPKKTTPKPQSMKAAIEQAKKAMSKHIPDHEGGVAIPSPVGTLKYANSDFGAIGDR